MYAKFANLARLKSHHHIRLDKEFKEDCRVWESFLSLNNSSSISRPFVDVLPSTNNSAELLSFSSDATANKTLGFGSIYNSSWLYGQWELEFMNLNEKYISIEFLELYALCVGIFTWGHMLQNRRVIVFCDNEAVVAMINSTSSSCKLCMTLIRKLTLKSLTWNVRVFSRHITGKNNFLSDSLSCLKIDLFRKQAKDIDRKIELFPTRPSLELWPLSVYWKINCEPLLSL